MVWYEVSYVVFFFFKQKTAYEMRISDWSSDVCSSDLHTLLREGRDIAGAGQEAAFQLGGRHLVQRGRQPGIVEPADPAGIDEAGGAEGGILVPARMVRRLVEQDRKSTRLNSSH